VKVVAVMVHAPRSTVTDTDGVPGTNLRPTRTCTEGITEVLAAARGVAGAIVRVAVLPGVDPQGVLDLGVAAGQVMTPKGESQGDRERATFQDLFRRGAKQVLLVRSDQPLLTGELLEDAFAALAANPGNVVIGPASDGCCYLLGLAAPQVPDLFTGVRFGTKYALMDTLRRCEFEERRVAFLPLLEDPQQERGHRTQEAGQRT